MYFIIIGVISIIVFTIFSRHIKKGGLTQIDFDTTVRIQGKIPVIEKFGSDELWEDASFFVSPPFSIFLVLVFMLITVLQKNSWKGRLLCLAIPLLFALMTAAEVYGKSVVHHPAPPFFMLKNPTTIFPKYHVQEDFSYPSGHMARATFFMMIISQSLLPMKFFQKRKIILLIILTIITSYVGLIAIGKIYLGHHWFSDIIGGGLLGIGFSLLALSIYLF